WKKTPQKEAIVRNNLKQISKIFFRFTRIFFSNRTFKMLTSFGKILRKLCIGHSEFLLDMAKKISYICSIFNFCRDWKKSVPILGIEQKIIKLYA
ncbi:MAG: hypothetical protein PV354_12495, partial [Bartonella sp.]|nr:hypothetical protein [Bartonella sp.]